MSILNQPRRSGEGLSYAVYYYRFPLRHRGIEELLFERGVIVSYESIGAAAVSG
jgi:transposase-like protein